MHELFLASLVKKLNPRCLVYACIVLALHGIICVSDLSYAAL
jgi:hypothetical protein